MTLALVLGACTSRVELAPAELSRQELAARHLSMLERKCASYGYQKGPRNGRNV